MNKAVTHEFKDIVAQYAIHAPHHKAVLATVVALDGSSYRKPGVRMLILDNDTMIGAVSGGCVEKEILRQAQAVFSSGISKMMHYDGRYRLGCEGLLYILIEPFVIANELLNLFQECIHNRSTFHLDSFYDKKESHDIRMGTYVRFTDKSTFPLDNAKQGVDTIDLSNLSLFQQVMPPCFQLIIIGTEHDAAQLSHLAAATGWEVRIVCGVKEQKTIKDFPGAKKMDYCSPESFNELPIDDQTAVVIMTHNYAKDLHNLIGLKNTKPIYIGVLGAVKRMEKLLMDFVEHCPEVDTYFLDLVRGPAGLNIGAIGPKEIAVSIIAEILTVVRQKETSNVNFIKENGVVQSLSK